MENQVLIDFIFGDPRSKVSSSRQIDFQQTSSRSEDTPEKQQKGEPDDDPLRSKSAVIDRTPIQEFEESIRKKWVGRFLFGVLIEKSEILKNLAPEEIFSHEKNGEEDEKYQELDSRKGFFKKIGKNLGFL